jgi:hypothetical protein
VKSIIVFFVICTSFLWSQDLKKDSLISPYSVKIVTKDVAVARKKIAVYKFESDALKPAQTLELSKFLTDELRKYKEFDVLDWSNVGQILGFVEEQKLVGELGNDNSKAQCSSDKCYAELGNRLGVELMIVGSVNQIGNRYLVNLSLQDIDAVKVLGTAKAQMRGDLGEILDSLPSLVAVVLNKPVPVKKQNFQSENITKNMIQKNTQTQSSNHKVRSWFRWGGLSTFLVAGAYAGFYNQKTIENKKIYDKSIDDFQSKWNQVEAARAQAHFGAVAAGIGFGCFSFSYLF